jgi:hypothetical protein
MNQVLELCIAIMGTRIIDDTSPLQSAFELDAVMAKSSLEKKQLHKK